MRQLKTLILIKSLETEFSIAICRPTGDKWQSNTLFQSIFDPRPSTVKSVVDCRLNGKILSFYFPGVDVSANQQEEVGDTEIFQLEYKADDTWAFRTSKDNLCWSLETSGNVKTKNIEP